jgi:quinol---cytochrome c reductase iron-sulfur subunit, bacillus type
MSDPSHDAGHDDPIESSHGTVELEFPGRRSFISVLLGVGSVAVGVLLAVPLVMVAVDPLFKKTNSTQWSEAGSAEDFAKLAEPVEPIIKVEQQDGWRLVLSEKPVFVLPPDAGPHRVLSPVCPHLGCQVEWVNNEKHFFCPCHATTFAADGSVVSGPAPRGLDYLESKVEDGKLMVQYQYFRLLVSNREVVG